ncbi:DUF2795 domain-containing protein [Paraburkholderia tropica]|uniref:DUF2795 domain-containing protein n=1 Tax=Paraburkholderia tropica TaxID=92647 RepID=UPI0007ED7CD2|nr:DUF2795 domain-containing protein [Paraburkholderia tropica]MBB2978956.1 hypothetical protein [Paraburkholderia tropica]OBR47059.1 hypothetical protein A6456_19510 [Paraburkholderia tropica]
MPDSIPDVAREALILRVERALDAVTFPAHPGTLLDCAEHSGARADVIDALRALPDEAFGSFSEVSASIVASHDRQARPRALSAG